MLKHIPFYGTLLGRPLTPRTNATHSHVLVYGAIEAHSLGELGCVASNATIAAETGLKESSVATIISTLAKANWVLVKLDKNNHRTGVDPLMDIKPPLMGIKHREQYKKASEPKGSEATPKAPSSFGKPEINDLFAYWSELTGYSVTSHLQKNRFSCNTLLKQHGAEGVRNLIRGVAAAQADPYGPRIADFQDLQFKLNKLILWAKQKGSNNEPRIATIG